MKSFSSLPLLAAAAYFATPMSLAFAGFLAPCPINAAPEINAGGSLAALAAVAAFAAIIWERRRRRS